MKLRLKEKREERNLTQKELAEKAKCSSDFISMIERGERNLMPDTAKRIADVLDCKWYELYE